MNPLHVRSWLLALSFTALPASVLSAQTTASAKPTGKPNIVVILADDVGYGDLGCYGATKVKTPNLDRLAANGRRFTDAHSPSSVCTPTRYALLTGQYAWRHPPGAGILSGVAPLCIASETLTVPALLKRSGYRTGVVGKWHLGLGLKETDYNREIKPGPREVGFDYSFIIPATGDRTPCVYVENHHVAGYDPKDPIQVNYTMPVGNEPTGAKNPELLKMKHSLGHDFTIVNGIGRIGFMTGGKAARWNDEDMADEITQRAVRFIEASKDGPFFLYFATHDIHVPRVPHPRFAGKSQHGLRGDVIQELDWSVGVILDTLDRLKLADNTIVIFTSDNGGVMDDGYQDGSGADTSGHRCNGRLRAFKGSLYEGGHRVPFIIRWPGHVPPGQAGDLICHVDLLATCAALTGQQLKAADGPDSFDISPALLGKAKAPCRSHLVHHTGSAGPLALREGDWVLLPGRNLNPIKGKQAGAKKMPELYNLALDLEQKENVAAQHPERVRDMTATLERLRDNLRSRPE